MVLIIMNNNDNNNDNTDYGIIMIIIISIIITSITKFSNAFHISSYSAQIQYSAPAQISSDASSDLSSY